MAGPVKYFDLTAQYQKYEARWFEAISELGAQGSFILGDAVAGLESELAEFLDIEHVITVASGTDALVLAMRAIGVGPGASVIVPGFGFFATPEAVSLVGAAPKFVDIRPDDFNFQAECVEAAIDSSTAAILPVHLFGSPADMDALCELGRKNGIPVIEDAAQSFGATFKGRCVGGIGDLGCFSFYPTKILGAYGDGGFVATRSAELAERVRLLRNHGIVGDNQHDLIGYTSRLNAVQAKLIQLKLEHVPDALARRRRIAQRYVDEFQDLDVGLPREREGTTHAYNIFTIRVRARDALVTALRRERIGHQVYYPKPLHEQAPYSSGEYPSGFNPECYRASAEALALPCYPEMPDSDVDRVCQVVREALA